MNMERIKTMARLMTDRGLEEISVHEDGLKLTLVKHRDAVAVAPGESPAEPLDAGNEDIQTKNEMTSAGQQGEFQVKSDRVGSFSRIKKNERDWPSDGDMIEEGDVVGTILSLDQTYETKASGGGQVISVHVSDGQVVEFAQVLFVLRQNAAVEDLS